MCQWNTAQKGSAEDPDQKIERTSHPGVCGDQTGIWRKPASSRNAVPERPGTLIEMQSARSSLQERRAMKSGESADSFAVVRSSQDSPELPVLVA